MASVNRKFDVGDRVYIGHSGSSIPEGVCGTVTGFRSLSSPLDYDDVSDYIVFTNWDTGENSSDFQEHLRKSPSR